MKRVEGAHWLPQLLRYGVVGLTAALTDFSVYWLLTAPFGIDPLLVNPISRSFGACTCFLVNKVWTFSQGMRRRIYGQFGKFWLVFLLSTALSELLLAIAVRWLEIPSLPAKMGVEALLFFLNFALLRNWVFR